MKGLRPVEEGDNAAQRNRCEVTLTCRIPRSAASGHKLLDLGCGSCCCLTNDC